MKPEIKVNQVWLNGVKAEIIIREILPEIVEHPFRVRANLVGGVINIWFTIEGRWNEDREDPVHDLKYLVKEAPETDKEALVRLNGGRFA